MKCLLIVHHNSHNQFKQEVSPLVNEIQNVTAQCTSLHKLTPEQLGQLRSPFTAEQAVSFVPAENLQVNWQS